MIQVLMLLSNPFRPDPRVQREMEVLCSFGYQVTLLCWDRKAEFPPFEKHAGGEIHRIHTVRSTYGAGVQQVFYLPRFWSAAVAAGAALKPDIVHCHDLDTLQAGARLKARLKCRLVYDAHEDYPALMSLYIPSLLVSQLDRMERRLLTQVDGVITASSVLAEKMRQRTAAPVAVIGNYPRLAAFSLLDEVQAVRLRTELGVRVDDYLAIYIGGFSRNRLLLPFIQAAENLPGWQLRLWGDGHQRAAIEGTLKGLSNILYPGWLPPDQVPLHTYAADVIYYCLKPDYPGAEFNAPNALSNAMLAGRPLIANQVGDLGRIVSQVGCGILLKDVTPASIRAALHQLEDPELRCKLGSAGRQAAEQQYNWEAASLDLLNIYKNLV